MKCKLTSNEVRWITQNLKKYSFINWDRFVFNKYLDGNGYYLSIFGWIKRKDNYKDFAYFEAVLKPVKEFNFIQTSSKKFSEKIAEINGILKEQHHVCNRIENYFKIKNCIKLKVKK